MLINKPHDILDTGEKYIRQFVVGNINGTYYQEIPFSIDYKYNHVNIDIQSILSVQLLDNDKIVETTQHEIIQQKRPETYYERVNGYWPKEENVIF